MADTERAPGDGGRPHVGSRRPTRRTIDPIDRLSEDEAEAKVTYVHDSSYTLRSNDPIAERSYRRAQADLEQAREADQRYAQYLSVPKGGRTIFTRRRSTTVLMVAVVVVAVLLVLVLVSLLIWGLILPA